MTDEGIPSVNQIRLLLEEFDPAEIFPFLAEGVSNRIIHSLLQTSYITIANSFNVTAAVEIPIFNKSFRKMSGGDTDRRTAETADAVWFDATGEPRVAIEVERFEKEPQQKVKHLIKYSRSKPYLDVVVLHYFDFVGHQDDLAEIRQMLSQGYRTNGALITLQSDVILVESLFRKLAGDCFHTHTKVIDLIQSQ